MFSKKIFIFHAILLSLVALSARNAAAYNVSGAVDLSYRGYAKEQDGRKTSYHTLTESLQTGLDGYVLDPRLLQFGAGVGYTIYSNSSNSSRSNLPDSRVLNYNLYTTFLPVSRVTWDLYGNRNIHTVQSEANIAGYDISNSNYGGILKLNLSRSGRGNNRNNYNNNNNSNNNNNNYNRARFPVQLPDIVLSHNRSESESVGFANPIKETRDDTKAKLTYPINASGSVNLDAGKSKYKNLIHDNSYEEKSLGLNSDYRFTPDALFNLAGYAFEIDGQRVPSEEKKQKRYGLKSGLTFKEKENLSHYYRYTFAKQKTSAVESSSSSFEAQARYRVLSNVHLYTGLNYATSDLVTGLSTTYYVPAKVETGGLVLGASYLETHNPSFLGPFSLQTAYDFASGYSKLKSDTHLTSNGSGYYYLNTGGIGISSTGWTRDNLGLDYSVSSRRDHSPVENNSLSHSVRLNASTSRISRTTLRASGSYNVQESYSGVGSSFLAITDNSRSRSLLYNIDADHRITYYLSAHAGAARQETSTTSQLFTLATLPIDPSLVKTYDDIYYIEARLNYPVRRNLVYRATIRDEYRSNNKIDSENYQVNMNLDYRLRQLVMNLEYRYRQDRYEHSPRSVQQFYYAKISRPF